MNRVDVPSSSAQSASRVRRAQSGIHVAHRLPVLFLQLDRAGHRIAEEQQTVDPGGQHEDVVAHGVARGCPCGDSGCDRHIVAIDRVEALLLVEQQHGLADAVLRMGIGHPRVPVAGAEPDRRIREIRGVVVDQPAGMVDMEMGAHHDVDVGRRCAVLGE